MKNHQLLNFIFLGIVHSLISESYSRPQRHPDDFGEYVDEINMITSELLTRLGSKNDYEKLNIPNLEIQNFNFTNNGSGNYYFTFNGGDIQGSEVGELKNPGTDNELQTVKGQYKYKIERSFGGGILWMELTIGYTADENGFRPFLIDIMVQAILSEAETLPEEKKGISSACLASLCGGNIG